MTGQRLFLAEIRFTAFLFSMLSSLTFDAECVIRLDKLSSLLLLIIAHFIIPFLYDLKGAFDSIQMNGHRLFLTGKMTGQTLFFEGKNDKARTFFS